MKFTNIIFFGVQSAAKPIRSDFMVPKKPRHSASRWRKMWYRRWKRMQVFLNMRVPPVKTKRILKNIKRKIRRSNPWVQGYFSFMLNRFIPDWNLHIISGLHGGRYLEEEITDLYKYKYRLKLRHLSAKNLRRGLRRYKPKYWDIVISFPRKEFFSYRGAVFFFWGAGDLDYFLKSALDHLVLPRFLWKHMRTGYSCLWIDKDVLQFYIDCFLYNENKRLVSEIFYLSFFRILTIYLFSFFNIKFFNYNKLDYILEFILKVKLKRINFEKSLKLL